MAECVSRERLWAFSDHLRDIEAFQSFAFADARAIVAPLFDDPPGPTPRIPYVDLIDILRFGLDRFDEEHIKVIKYLKALYVTQDEDSLVSLARDILVTAGYLLGVDVSACSTRFADILADDIYLAFESCGPDVAFSLYEMVMSAMGVTEETLNERVTTCTDSVHLLFASDQVMTQPLVIKAFLAALEAEVTEPVSP